MILVVGYKWVMFQKPFGLILFEAVSRPDQFDTFFTKIGWKMRQSRPKNDFQCGGSEGGQKMLFWYILIILLAFKVILMSYYMDSGSISPSPLKKLRFAFSFLWKWWFRSKFGRGGAFHFTKSCESKFKFLIPLSKSQS